jgi:hypothetical protein
MGDEVRVTGFPALPEARSAFLKSSRHHYLVTHISSPVSRHEARQAP